MAAHCLRVALYGNQGLPVICLHGGPGAGTSPLMHRFFDPEIYHILCFDQRGCGQSTLRFAQRQHNRKLLNDIDQLRMMDSLDTRYSEVLGVLLSLATLIESPLPPESSYVEFFEYRK